MRFMPQPLQRLLASQQAGSALLIAATCLALITANSGVAGHYQALWQTHGLGLSLGEWVNDGLMAIFFLLIGLELKRELYVGELSTRNHALLPTIAAIGGMLLPALIFWQLNKGTAYQPGVGIPMATDIVFALGVLSVLGSRVPVALKVFLMAFAVIDDLGAAILIAVFYTDAVSWLHLVSAVVVLASLFALNRLQVLSILPYALGGGLLWWLTLKSGVHPTVAGVALAFAIPFAHQGQASLSHRLEHFLQPPVALLILPVFAFANTGLALAPGTLQALFSHSNSLGIIAGLLLGKPLGITLAVCCAVKAGLCTLPPPLRWAHIIGAGMLGGVGFTMSIFIANLAFAGQAELIELSKMAILSGSLLSGLAGWAWLRATLTVKPAT